MLKAVFARPRPCDAQAHLRLLIPLTCDNCLHMETIVDSERLLSVSEAALRLGVSPHSIRRYIGSGELRATKLGPGLNSPLRIEERDLQRFLDRHVVEPTRDAA